MSLTIFLALVCLVLGQQFEIAYLYNDCSSKHLLGYAAFLQDPQDTCVVSGCVCDPNYGCGEYKCNQSSIPNDPPNSVVYKEFSATGCKAADLKSATASQSGKCFSQPAQNGEPAFSIRQTCGGTVKYEYWDGIENCAGDPTDSQEVVLPSRTICVPGGSESFSYSCTNPACIHEDTKFTYKGAEHSFKELPYECVVPHSVTRDGVKIATSCPGVLRVTHEHLVMTPSGWAEAGSIKVGDLLYSKINGEESCTVTSVQTEQNQVYSGLNCIESEIEADGYWISTFGSTHALPAFWMKYASQVIGLQRASSIGDYFANLFYGYY